MSQHIAHFVLQLHYSTSKLGGTQALKNHRPLKLDMCSEDARLLICSLMQNALISWVKFFNMLGIKMIAILWNKLIRGLNLKRS